MKIFVRKILIYSILVFIINLVIGKIFDYDYVKKTEQKCFYPSLRWNEFYDKTTDSIDVLFLGSSHAYRSFNPAIFDSVTSLSSFNLGSSVQTTSTSYFVLLEALEFQNPKLVYLDIFPFTINHHQFEAVSYNLPYMKSFGMKLKLFYEGLSFKEKIIYTFPAYNKRKNLFSTMQFLVNPKYIVDTDELYLADGFVTSQKYLDVNYRNQILSKWKPTKLTHFHMENLQNIVDICKKKDILLIMTRTPTASKVYKNLNEFDLFINTFAQRNCVKYINFDEYAKNSLTNLDFKNNGHLNINGAKKISRYLGKYTTKFINIDYKN